MTKTQVAAYVLNTLGLALQLIGAALVIRDIRDSQSNMRTLKGRLDDAERTRQTHIAALSRPVTVLPGDWMAGRRRRDVTIPEEVRENIADQLGPASAEERAALVEYVTAQNDRTGWQLWTGVALVVAGAFVAYAASIITI